MAPTPDGKGYWLVASDGGIFNFGDAGFYGSAAGGPSPTRPRRSCRATGHGYWVEEQNGTAYPFGDAPGAPPTEGLLFQPVTPGDKAVLFAFAATRQALHLGRQRPRRLRLLGAGPGFVGARRRHRLRPGGRRPVPHGRHTGRAHRRSPPATSCSGALSQTDWTSVYHTAIYVGGDRIVEATGDHVQLNSLDQWGLGDIMPNGRRP